MLSKGKAYNQRNSLKNRPVDVFSTDGIGGGITRSNRKRAFIDDVQPALGAGQDEMDLSFNQVKEGLKLKYIAMLYSGQSQANKITNTLKQNQDGFYLCLSGYNLKQLRRKSVKVNISHKQSSSSTKYSLGRKYQSDQLSTCVLKVVKGMKLSLQPPIEGSVKIDFRYYRN